MPVKQRLLELVAQAHQAEIAFITGLSDAERAEQGTVDCWSPKDMLAHMLEWKLRMVRNYGLLRRGETVPQADDDIDHQNAKIFEEHHGKSWDEIRGMADRARDQVVAIIDAASEEDLTDPERSPWPDKRLLWQRIAGNSVTHPVLHLAQYYADHGQIEHATQLQEDLAQTLIGLDDAADWRGIAIYNLACFYAIAGCKDKALSLLAESLQLNPGLTEWSKEDPDFASIREDPEYLALYA